VLVTAVAVLLVSWLAWERFPPLARWRRLAPVTAVLAVVLAVGAVHPGPTAVAGNEPASVVVPDVAGRPLGEAMSRLAAAGLSPRIVLSCGEGPIDTVVRVATVRRTLWWGLERDLVTADGVLVAPGEVASGAEVLVWGIGGEPCRR